MADDIALSDFPSCHAGRIRAKYLRSIHLFCWCFHSYRLQIDALFFLLPRTSIHQLMGSYHFIWRCKSFEEHTIHINPPKVQSWLAPGIGTSSGARINQNLLRCLVVSCAEETYWPGVTPSSRLKRCVKWLCVLKPRSYATWASGMPHASRRCARRIRTLSR